jgi:AcrR family transcriptional regulator
MPQIEINTEQSILNAAEALFLEKGFSATKTTQIAKAAGVNHAMLHYYFRTKEKLFDKVFEQKIHLLTSSFLSVFESGKTFIEKVRLGVEAHFDFLVAHPKIPFFILREVVGNREKLEMAKRLAMPKIQPLFQRLTQEMEEEIERGRIATSDPIDLMVNMVSLNVFSIISCQIFFGAPSPEQFQEVATYLNHRKRENVEMVVAWLHRKPT